MDLRHLTDETLAADLDFLVVQEKQLLTKVLHHLKEFDRRRLFSALGYTSLFDYAVRKLGYSEDQAYRRIAAMRLMKDMPDLDRELETGRLTLTHIGIAQAAFKREREAGNAFSVEEKTATLKSIAGLSTRDAEAKILEISPKSQDLEDRVEQVSSDKVEIEFEADLALKEKLDRLRGLLAHKSPGITLAEMMDWLCDLAIEKLDKGAKEEKKEEEEKKKEKKKKAKDLLVQHDLHNQSDQRDRYDALVPAAPRVDRDTHFGSACDSGIKPASKAEIIRRVWRRDRSQCAKCGSQHALQIDHVVPKALGGENTEQNLRLLCRHCNQRAAIEKLGVEKMRNYLRAPVAAYVTQPQP
jgi:hypothetical protein